MKPEVWSVSSPERFTRFLPGGRRSRSRRVLPFALGALVLVVGVGVHRWSQPDTTPGGATPLPETAESEGDPSGLESAESRLRPKLRSWPPRARLRTGSVGAAALPWFEQGLNFYWAGNSTAARQSFLEAARIAPDCAMCWWGASLAIGPQPMAGMQPEHNRDAFEWARNARLLSKPLEPREQGYIQSLSLRYTPSIPDRRAPLDLAYAEAISELSARHADDADLHVLRVEALMVVHGWSFLDGDGDLHPWARHIDEALEQALALAPGHPGALRYGIHFALATGDLSEALQLAERLSRESNGQGHLLHVPAHAYFRAGRYAEAAQAEAAAVEADRAFLSEWPLNVGLYASAFVPHHLHGLTQSQAMQGNFAEAMAAARALSASLDMRLMHVSGYEGMQHQWVAPYMVLLRFGRWAQILALPPPPAHLAYPTAIWHYIRGMAMLRGGSIDAATRELTRIATIAAHPQLQSQTTWGGNGFDQLAGIAELLLAAEIAILRQEPRLALAQLQQAVKIESGLKNEYPMAWGLPVKQVLGAALLSMNKGAQAEAVYREDLENYPENGWSLLGLSQSLEAQDKASEAVKQRFKKAWAEADVELSQSRF